MINAWGYDKRAIYIDPFIHMVSYQSKKLIMKEIDRTIHVLPNYTRILTI